MRKLKLQMHISIDGFAAAKNNSTSKEDAGWDDEVRNHSIANLDNVDSILLGSTTAADFIPHWGSVAANPSSPDYVVGKLLTDIPKIVFSKTITAPKWENATMVNGDLAGEVNKLKSEDGAGMIVYGGVSFVSSLISSGLIDEYHLLINPAAWGSGIPIFKQNTNLKLISVTPFACGLVLHKYRPA